MDEDEERVLEDMMVLKLASRTYRHKGEDGGLMQGSRVVNNNLDFFVDNVCLSPSLLPSLLVASSLSQGLTPRFFLLCENRV